MVKTASSSTTSATLPVATVSPPVQVPSASTGTGAPAKTNLVEHPVLEGKGFILRELRLTDAPTLMTSLTPEEVVRFISVPPATLLGFEEFIKWTHRRSAAGQHVCFAVVPDGLESAVGLFQIRALTAGFATAEWGFALATNYWGTGLFVDAATLVVSYAFDHLGTHRLEARSVVCNGRGNGALRKIGAVLEAVLHRSFIRGGQHLDQVLWAIRRDDWQAARMVDQPAVHEANRAAGDSLPFPHSPSSSHASKPWQTVAFSVEPSHRPSACFWPSTAIPSATMRQRSPTWTPSISNATRSRVSSATLCQAASCAVVRATSSSLGRPAPSSARIDGWPRPRASARRPGDRGDRWPPSSETSAARPRRWRSARAAVGW